LLREIELSVNGNLHRVAAKPHETLVEVLRDRLHLHTVREGCGMGVCGSCTVLVEGRPVSACLLFASEVGARAVVTLEGIAKDGELHPVQRAFLEACAFQCSFCTPGFILSTIALLRELPNPTDDDIRKYLAGNLCRCGSYVKILQAVKAARAALE
jgi:carbon-monoxide dehydrogenase small subunit